ncbi:MAG: undecaprenyl-diphosphate phosphatase [Halieaceae bacterium]
MIDWLQASLLAVLQGLTEFLPISSSAHLVIPSLVLSWPDQGLAFDVAVHVGTLTAVLFYYRSDLFTLATGCSRALAERQVNEHSRMVGFLAAATVPVAVVGVVGGSFIESDLRNLPVIATTTLVFGLLLGYADRYTSSRTGYRMVTLPIALMIGIAQALAPVPGVSRSGVTITAALLLDLDRQSAARFSFLLSIPVIAGAGLLKAWQLSHSGVAVDWALLSGAALVAGITAYLCIAVFLRLLDRVGLMPFVYYRIFLAVLLYGIWLY